MRNQTKNAIAAINKAYEKLIPDTHDFICVRVGDGGRCDAKAKGEIMNYIKMHELGTEIEIKWCEPMDDVATGYWYIKFKVIKKEKEQVYYDSSLAPKKENRTEHYNPFHIPNMLRLNADGNLYMVDGSSVQEYLKAFYTKCHEHPVMTLPIEVNIATHRHYSHLRECYDGRGC